MPNLHFHLLLLWDPHERGSKVITTGMPQSDKVGRSRFDHLLPRAYLQVPLGYLSKYPLKGPMIPSREWGLANLA